jgi:F-type H+-transporting ATPase subunit epsilon
MAERLRLVVAAPDRQLVDEDVDELQVPAADGYIGVLPGHAPLLTALGAGALTFRKGGEASYLAIEGGVMEVLPDRVRVLVGNATWASEIDLEAARMEIQRAIQILDERLIDSDLDRAQKQLAQARAQLEAFNLAARK